MLTRKRFILNIPDPKTKLSFLNDTNNGTSLTKNHHSLQTAKPKKAETQIDEPKQKFNGLSATVICFAVNPATGKKIKVRALLDSGANSNFFNKKSLSKAQFIRTTDRNIHDCHR